MQPIDAEIQKYMPWVRLQVWRRLRRGGMHMEMRDDLLQSGRIAIWHAIEQHDPAKGAFEPFAMEMIRYHILEEVRGADYLSPWMRRKASAGEFETTTFIPLDDVAEQELQSDAEPGDMLALEQCRRYLALLPARWQQIIVMRYERDMTWAAIGAACDCNANSAQQMCSRAQKTLLGWLRSGRYRPLAKWAGLAKHAGRQRSAP